MNKVSYTLTHRLLVRILCAIMIKSGFMSAARVLVAAVLLAGTVTSCSTKSVGNGATIFKVTPYHLAQAQKPIDTSDPSLVFERQYLVHGAIDPIDFTERQGNYYSVFWGVEDRSQPVKVRFEYRQKNTGLTIKTVEQEVADYDGYNVTKFELIGDNYAINGPVSSWRASVVRGKDVLVSYNSYLWE